MFDGNTRRAIEVPAHPFEERPAVSVGGFVGADGLINPSQEFVDVFGAMQQATAFTSFPTRANCKLVMRFVDQGGIDRWFVASGAMQDAGVVLTAAHCVYARNPDGINIFDWARDIWIYPGWDGVGNPGPGSPETMQAWGWTHGNWFLAGSGWVNNGNFNEDIGAIRVSRGSDRMVGMLTGWFGLASGGNCGIIQSRIYYNYAYPAQSCGQPGLHNGRDMYLWAGFFDFCVETNQLQITTTPGCFTNLWGGMSGSNAYFSPNGTDRYAHAIASNSDRSTYGRFCKMWDGFANTLNATFRPGTRGTTFDLEALQFRLLGPTIIQAGSSAAESQFLATNATDADRPSASYTVRVYLSTNSDITNSDTLLGTFAFSNHFGPMHNFWILLPAITIPASTTPGTYWLGVILDTGIDSFPDNNDTDSWDAQQITVLPAPAGACCFVSGDCAVLSAAGCSAQNGVYRGDNTSCATANCPLPTGACCLPNLTCVSTTAASCTSQGGAYRGDNTVCATANCATPGACCLANGNCIQVTNTNCTNQGGTYRGDGTTCATANCPPPGVFVIQPGPEGTDTFFGTTFLQNGAPDLGIMYYGGWGDSYFDYLKFDLSGSPSAAATVTCTLNLYADTAPNDPGLQINRITQSWTEAGVTATANPSSVFFRAFGPVLPPTGWKAVDITNLYKDWKNDVYPNHGIKLLPTANNQTNGSFASSDHVDPALRPKLVVVVNGALCYANCDGSTTPPVLTANDFQCFINLFAAVHPNANCDGSTTPPVLTANDFQCFINQFATGCP